MTRVLKHPQHASTFEVTFFNNYPQLIAAASRKAPLHFHPYQEEHLEVLEVEGDERTLLPDDGTICVRPWTNHRVYPPQNCKFESTKFLLWADQTAETFTLDLIFLTHWYSIQGRVVLQGKGINLL